MFGLNGDDLGKQDGARNRVLSRIETVQAENLGVWMADFGSQTENLGVTMLDLRLHAGVAGESIGGLGGDFFRDFVCLTSLELIHSNTVRFCFLMSICDVNSGLSAYSQ
jgi:hypothetical protein